MKKQHPTMRIVANEALQCPTLFNNGFGDHRIEGIGDKHVPWIHNVRNTDAAVAIDDEDTMRLLRLFNEPAGHAWLEKQGVPKALIEQLPMLGISAICNTLSAVKMAKYFELTSDDVIVTVFTDAESLYRSRLEELRHERGAYTELDAARDLDRRLHGQGTDYLKELGYRDRKALHHLKYFTWVEQQGKTADELRALWDPAFWDARYAEALEWDALIDQFNARTGVLASM